MIGFHQKPSAPLVSVVMAVYEPQPEYLRKAVLSIMAQSVQDWELIIVEDPSSWSAAGLLRELADTRVRHIVNSERTGLVAQRNRCLSEARGRFVAIMDSDDIAHPFRFVKQINFLQRRPDVHIVGSQIGVIDSEDRLVGYRWYPGTHGDIQRAITRIVPLGQPAVMLRREVFESFGGYRFVEFPAAEDYEYWSRLIEAGVRFTNLPEVLYYYRMHPAQIKIAKLRETIRAVLRVKEMYWADRLDLASRVQMWGERLLLYLPKRVVAWMLLRGRWHYRPRAIGPRICEFPHLDSPFGAHHERGALLHHRRAAVRNNHAAARSGAALANCDTAGGDALLHAGNPFLSRAASTLEQD